MAYYKTRPAIRAGWLRAILFTIVWILLLGLTSLAVAQILKLVNVGLNEQGITYDFLGYGINLLLTIILLAIFMRFIDREPFGDLGIRLTKRKTDVVVGFFWSGLMISVGAFILGRTGHIEFFPGQVQLRYFLLSLLFFLMVSVFEEIVFRGYLLKNLAQSMPKFVALIVSSVAFAAVHLFNPNIDLMGFVNLVLGGLFLGIAYVFTKNIYMAIGLHWGWNFFQGPVWGFEVSGHSTKSLWQQEMIKDNLFSGGDFGFEGSILSTLILAITLIAFFVYYNNKYGETSI